MNLPTPKTRKTAPRRAGPEGERRQGPARGPGREDLRHSTPDRSIGSLQAGDTFARREHLHGRGRALAYERRGADRPLLVLNGYAGTKADWDPGFIAALAADRELILLDHRGIGDSAGDGQPFSIEDLAGDAAGAIGAIGLERPDVLGWSMGGFVALALTLADPARVGKLVLLSTSAGAGPATPSAIRTCAPGSATSQGRRASRRAG